MKTLIDFTKKSKLKVVKLHAPKELKQRLISFGIIKESIIEVIEYAPAKSTVEIKVGKMHIAIRAEEAKLVEVEEV